MTRAPRTAIAGIVLGAIVASACGGAPAAVTVPGGSGEVRGTVTDSGARVVVLRRQTSGLVHLALFIDAGARDAAPPQVATIAAWLAAEHGGELVRAHVAPDGTELSVTCDTSELEACVGRLARALALRSASPDALGRARARLSDARRRALTSEARAAERIALEALLGEDTARGLDPLGRAEDDDAASTEAVAAFLAAHYGAARTMLVAAGDVDAEAVIAASDAFASIPEARASRDARVVAIGTGGVRAEIGDARFVALAAHADDLAHAHAIAERTASRWRPGGGVAAHAFELRGGAIALVVGRAERVIDAAERGALELALAAERRGETVQADAPDDPDAAARRVGIAWAASSSERAVIPDAPVIAIGAIVPGGRGDRPRARDPDADLRADASRRLERVHARAIGAVAPRLRGHVADGAVSAVVDGGARIEVQTRAGDGRVGIAIRFAGGAAEEPASVHGRTALLATTLATGCGALAPAALEQRLRSMRATIAPEVDATSFGIVVEADRDAWEDALELALDCATPSELDRVTVEEARRRLLATHRRDETIAMASWAARAIAPASPGRVAPWGDARTIARVSTGELEEARGSLGVAARASVAIAGDVPAREVARRAAPRLALLPRGTLPARTSASDGGEELVSERWDGVVPRVIVAWRADRADASEREALAFGAAAARAIARARGVRVVWAGGGATRAGAWAAFAIDADEATIAALPEIAASAARAAVGDVAAEIARAERARRWAAARPGVAARERARERLAGRAESAAGGATAQALAAGRARFVIGRAVE